MPQRLALMLQAIAELVAADRHLVQAGDQMASGRCDLPPDPHLRGERQRRGHLDGEAAALDGARSWGDLALAPARVAIGVPMAVLGLTILP